MAKSEAHLSDVTESIQYGYTAKSSVLNAGPKYLRITDIQNGQVDWNAVPQVSVDSADRSRYCLQRGDIVFARSGATVGKSFLIRDNPEEAIFASYLIRVRCKGDRLDPEYAAYFFRSEAYWKQIRDGASGTGQPNFNGTKLGDLRIPIRPLREQRAIVRKLDSLFGRSKSARDQLARIPRLIERYREAVLAAAARGDLTTNWRMNNADIEPATELLRTIHARLGKHQQPTGFSLSNGRVLPKKWTYCRVGDVGVVTLGRQRSPQHHSGKHMRPYLRVANVFENRIDVSDVMEMNFTPAEYDRFKLRPGDILLNEGQSKELIGRPAMFMGELEDVCFTNTLVRFRAYQPISASYALIVFRHYMRSGLFQSIANITTNIAHLGAGRFADLPFPLPPAAEQEEVVQLCAGKLEALDRIAGEGNLAAGQINRLDSEVLAKAFRGELVTQQQLTETERAV